MHPDNIFEQQPIDQTKREYLVKLKDLDVYLDLSEMMEVIAQLEEQVSKVKEDEWAKAKKEFFIPLKFSDDVRTETVTSALRDYDTDVGPDNAGWYVRRAIEK
jgi:ribosomal protein L11 methylase PrmA